MLQPHLGGNGFAYRNLSMRSACKCRADALLEVPGIFSCYSNSPLKSTLLLMVDE